MRKLWPVLLIAAGIAVITSCSRNEPGALNIGDKAPEFTLTDLDGREVSLSSLPRDREILLNFWATWCPGCREEVPHLNEIYRKYKDKVTIVGIDIRESEETVKNFEKFKGLEYRILLDDKGDIARRYGIFGIPTNILISKDGLVKNPNLDIQEMESYFRKM